MERNIEERRDLSASAFDQIGNFAAYIDEEFFDVNKCLTELDIAYDELKSILASITLENPICDTFLKGKYLILVLKNILPWQKPLGEYFGSSFVICAAKLKKNSASGMNTTELFPDESGNPLSIQFDTICEKSEKQTKLVLKQLNTKYHLYALPEEIGRKLLYMCAEFETALKLPFIAICQKNNFRIFFSGAYQKQRCFHLKVVNQGSVTSTEKLPSIYCLKDLHLEGFAPGNSVESHALAHYDFLSQDSEENSSLVPIKDANLAIKCSWSDVHSVLEPLTPECICIAKLKTVAGNDETGVFNKYKQVKLLKDLQCSLQSGLMTWLNSDSSGFVMNQINNLVCEEKNSADNREYFNDSKIGLDHLEAIAKERASLYFPDKLWLILKNCSSFGELVEGLKHTYKVLSELFIYPPLTHGKDMSTISKDINSMLEKPIACPKLDPKKAAELLLEIGVEKLRKDYEHFFLDLGLVPRDLFHQYIQPELLSTEAIISLEKLHSVLELTLICMKWLKLPINILSEFARSALKHYTLVPEVDLQHIFNFHIPAVYARPLLNQMRPTVWELSLKTSDTNYSKQSIHRFVTTASHDHIYASKNYHPKLMLKGASYAYLTGTLIEETD